MNFYRAPLYLFYSICLLYAFIITPFIDLGYILAVLLNDLTGIAVFLLLAYMSVSMCNRLSRVDDDMLLLIIGFDALALFSLNGIVSMFLNSGVFQLPLLLLSAIFISSWLYDKRSKIKVLGT